MISKTITTTGCTGELEKEKKPVWISVCYLQNKRDSGMAGQAFLNTEPKVTDIASECCVFHNAVMKVLQLS